MCHAHNVLLGSRCVAGMWSMKDFTELKIDTIDGIGHRRYWCEVLQAFLI
jgi:hypothetical protein